MTASASDEAPDILVAITRFLDHLRFERRLSPTTLAGRSRDLAAFHSWCDTVQIHALTRIDVQAMRSYAARMRRDGRAAPTLERHLSSLRAWFASCIEQSWFTHNPAAEVRAPRTARALPKTLTRERARSAVEAPGENQGVIAVRDRAMLELLYSSGLRRAE